MVITSLSYNQQFPSMKTQVFVDGYYLLLNLQMDGEPLDVEVRKDLYKTK